MTPNAQMKTANIGRQAGVGKTCSAGMVYTTRLLRAAHLSATFTASKVTSVEISGEAATATTIVHGHAGPIYLRRIDSRWLVVNGPSGNPDSGFCDSSATGRTPSAAIHAYLTTCGPYYSIQSGPYDIDPSTTSYRNYAKVVECDINVKYNQEGPVDFLMIGQRRAGQNWHTLGSPGTGP
jgi:hypothetical protein